MKQQALARVKQDLFWKGQINSGDVPPAMRDFPAVFAFVRGQKLASRMLDKDPHVPPLDPHTWASGNVPSGQRVFFKLFLPAEAGQASVTLEMRIDAGEADLFLGNGDLTRYRSRAPDAFRPCFSRHLWLMCFQAKTSSQDALGSDQLLLISRAAPAYARALPRACSQSPLSLSLPRSFLNG